MRNSFWDLRFVLVPTSSANAQQHAPAGGAWYGGHFYKGGQFMPNGAFGGFAGPGMQSGGMDGFFPGMSSVQEQPKTSYRRSARTKARTSARTVVLPALDQSSVAISRLKMAKNLVKLGRYEQAKGWLTKVSEMNADPESVAEACRLACEIDELTDKPAAPRKVERED